jgi:hypothetical protein
MSVGYLSNVTDSCCIFSFPRLLKASLSTASFPACDLIGFHEISHKIVSLEVNVHRTVKSSYQALLICEL